MVRATAHLEPLAPAARGRPGLTRDDVLDAHEVADLLRLPVSTVLEYARRAVIPGHKLGRRWLFLRDEIELAVRAAPGHPCATQRPQPPAQPQAPPTPNRPKRYPRAVPSPDHASQQPLFG